MVMAAVIRNVEFLIQFKKNSNVAILAEVLQKCTVEVLKLNKVSRMAEFMFKYFKTFTSFYHCETPESAP